MTNSIPTFTDVNGTSWHLRLTTRDIDRVRDHVTNSNGQPVDLLDMAERGNFSSIINDMRLFPTIVFWLVQDQVADRFNLDEYDAQHSKIYTLDESLKRQPPLQKAANWFGSLLDGDALNEMSKAFCEAIVNFTDPRIREKLKNVMAKQEELQKVALDKAEEVILREIRDGQDALSMTALQSSELTPENTLSQS